MQRSGHKVQRSGPASALVGTDAATTCNYYYYHHHQGPDRASTITTSDRIGPAQHDAAISATCVRAKCVEEMGALTQVALIAASCCAGPKYILYLFP